MLHVALYKISNMQLGVNLIASPRKNIQVFIYDLLVLRNARLFLCLLHVDHVMESLS
jgi:hypothetical protein